VGSDGGDCRQHCGAGRQAIVHEDDRRISDVQFGGGKETGTTLKLKALPVPGGIERLAADPQPVDDLPVAEFCDLSTDHGQGSHCELTASWHPDFAYQDHPERGGQPSSYLGTNRYSAAWQRQHDRLVQCGIRNQNIG
jgi:hypothetical protein